MTGLNIESLKGTEYRQAYLSPEKMKAQIEAVKHLVGAAHDQLVAHQINRDEKSGWPLSDCRYDAFFRIPDEEVGLKISSVGLPDERSNNGLFVYMNTKQEGEISEIVGLQTAKIPDEVREGEALWLSRLRPEQLDQLAKLIKSATPIDKNAYDLYLGRREWLPPSNIPVKKRSLFRLLFHR
jgi:hypothetical protein